MTIPRAIILGLGLIAVLYFTDRIVTGIAQCESFDACPYAREFGGPR